MPIDFAFRTLMTHPAESGFSTVSPSALSPPSRCPPVVDGGAFMLCLARRGGSLRAALGRRAAFRMNAQAFGVAVPGNRSGCRCSLSGGPHWHHDNTVAQRVSILPAHRRQPLLIP